MISGFIGLLLSVAWLAAAAFYMDKFVGLPNLMSLLPNEQAMIVAGLCAPLALIWIVVTWISNGLKLRRMRRELRSLRALVTRVAPPAAAGAPGKAAAPAPASPAPKAPAPAPKAPAPAPAPKPAAPAPKPAAAAAVPAPKPAVPAPAPVPAPRPSAPAPAAKAPAGSGQDVQKVMASLEKVAVAAKQRDAAADAKPADAKPADAKAAPPPAASAPAPSAPAASPAASPGPAPQPAAAAKEPNLSVVKGTGSAAQPKARPASTPGSQTLAQMEALVGATKRDLNALANDLVFGLRSEQDHAAALSAYNGGQKDAFFAVLWEHLRRSSRDQVAKAVQESGVGDLVTAYRQKFEDLAKEVQTRDPSGQALQAIRKQPMGRVYDALRDRLG